jgi:hypothetical protein
LKKVEEGRNNIPEGAAKVIYGLSFMDIRWDTDLNEELKEQCYQIIRNNIIAFSEQVKLFSHYLCFC